MRSWGSESWEGKQGNPVRSFHLLLTTRRVLPILKNCGKLPFSTNDIWKVLERVSLKNWKKKKNWNDLQTKGGRPINLNSTNLEEVVVLLWDCNIFPRIWHFLTILNLCPKNLKELQCKIFLGRKLVSNCLILSQLETNQARLLFYFVKK